MSDPVNAVPPVPAGQHAPPAEAAFEGHPQRECGEHRTVGPHRAWCFADSEWCYPDALCRGCRLGHTPPAEAIEADAEGYVPFIAAEGWREDTSIRFVPESAVAEAVAAQRAADEAEFAARIAQQQDATQGIVARAVQNERDRIWRLAVKHQAVAHACLSTCQDPSHNLPFADLIDGTP